MVRDLQLLGVIALGVLAILLFVGFILVTLIGIKVIRDGTWEELFREYQENSRHKAQVRRIKKQFKDMPGNVYVVPNPKHKKRQDVWEDDDLDFGDRF